MDTILATKPNLYYDPLRPKTNVSLIGYMTAFAVALTSCFIKS